MMMERSLKHSKKSETTQCPHNNTGYCKFNDQCRYQHYNTICEKSICRDIGCKKRHPRTCRYGKSCKFNIYNACFYKHDKDNQSNEKEIKKLTEKLETIEKEVNCLKAEICQLKDVVKMKESQLRENSVDISEMKKKIKLLECKNETLKTQIHEKETENYEMKTLLTEKDERIKFQNTKIVDMENDKDVNKVKHIKNSSKSNLQASNHKDKKTSSCDSCDFTYSNQFDLLIHKSAKHPSYILNSQPEAVTGPLH